MVFWQSPRTSKKARPNVRLPIARAARIEQLEIVVDAHERYPYRFGSQQVRTVTRGLPCGDYAVAVGGRLMASVERKSLPDLISSLTSGRLAFALGQLAALPRAAVVVEDRYSRIFAGTWVRPAVVADGLAELQVRWPTVPVVFCDNRKLAEEWTYRYLAAAQLWAQAESSALARMGLDDEGTDDPPGEPDPSPTELRAWARAAGLAVSDRGRLRPEVLEAWRAARLPTAGPTEGPPAD